MKFPRLGVEGEETEHKVSEERRGEEGGVDPIHVLGTGPELVSLSQEAQQPTKPSSVT